MAASRDEVRPSPPPVASVRPAPPLSGPSPGVQSLIKIWSDEARGDIALHAPDWHYRAEGHDSLARPPGGHLPLPIGRSPRRLLVINIFSISLRSFARPRPPPGMGGCVEDGVTRATGVPFPPGGPASVIGYHGTTPALQGKVLRLAKEPSMLRHRDPGFLLHSPSPRMEDPTTTTSQPPTHPPRPLSRIFFAPVAGVIDPLSVRTSPPVGSFGKAPGDDSVTGHPATAYNDFVTTMLAGYLGARWSPRMGFGNGGVAGRG